MKITSNLLIILTAIFITTVDNSKFFSQLMVIYPVSKITIGFILSTAGILCAVLVVIFSLFNLRSQLKPVLVFSLFCASFISYFSNTYSIVLDRTMIQNVVETNMHESLDLLSFKLLLYVVGFGILPSALIFRAKVDISRTRQRLFMPLGAIVVIASLLLLFSNFYATFFREHKELRQATNPTYAFYAAGEYLISKFNQQRYTLKPIGLDAKPDPAARRRRLTIMVVGEAVRADHFSLNGYARNTNPLLENEEVINFSQMSSCGTSTAVSVPCMFSVLERKTYDDAEAQSTENVLDVLARAGVNILWRDNNSSSKGVADRLPYQNFRTSELNPECDDGECRDLGMLEELQNYVDRQSGDILIVLHQMGNHGPAYYKRYPRSFEIFTPVCATNQLEKCQPEEIINAYDNAIRYTDFFLTQVIRFLQQNDVNFYTALFYMSDHGESLGEKGIYLHGLPYWIAPEAQKHVAAFLWLDPALRASLPPETLTQIANIPLSQDNLFHTLLGLMKVQTEVYNASKDIFAVENFVVKKRLQRGNRTNGDS